MNFINILSDITNEDERISNLLDKAYENYLNSNKSIDPENIKVKAYKTVDELNDLEYMKSLGYKAKELVFYKKSHFAIFTFVKE
ncbi:MAG: hypothetical protein ABF289_09280 [Clostridiales bacterium]